MLAERPLLEVRFNDAMVSIYTRAKVECDYTATRFLQMVTELGGLRAAKVLLQAAELSDGFTELWLRRRLDLTMEALIVENPVWHPLFTQEELQIARKRLTRCQYEPRRAE